MTITTSDNNKGILGGVDDKIVQSAIISYLRTTFRNGDVTTTIRPNKLRKIICKKVSETTWTQFAKCLETVLEDEGNDFQMDEKNENIIITTRPSTTKEKEQEEVDTSSYYDNNNTTKKDTTNQKAKVIATKNIQVPRAIALHLTRKGFLKKRNIERNTKTKLTLHGIGRLRDLPSSSLSKEEEEVKNKDNDVSKLDELVTIQITRYSLLLPNAPPPPTTTTTTTTDNNDTDESELAKKHIKTAQLLLEKMVQSYKKHPDRFVPKKAGGTLEEQAEQQKQKQEVLDAATRSKGKKKNKNKDKDNKLPVKGHVKTRRKKEKFY